MYKILVVDDEPKIAELLKVCLEMQGMEVSCAENGREALEIFAKSPAVPVMFLTAKGDILDRIKGLNVGADDYLVKPFDPMEAAARVSATLRRCYGYDRTPGTKKLTCGDLSLDTLSKRLYKKDVPIELTALEYKMIEVFMENQGRVLTKNQIYEAAWDQDKFPDDNSIMVAISKLRGKISDESHDYIKTIRGLGYRLEG